MIIHYINRAVRETFKNPFYSLINIGGLALGLAAFLLIMTYLRFETSFDRFITDGDRIHRIEINYANPNGTNIKSSPGPVSAKPAFLAEFPDTIESSTRFFVNSDIEVRAGDRVFLDDIYVADGEFFDVFDLPFVIGDREKAFSTLDSVVLSETAAEKYFPGENPTGKRLNDYLVSGVFADLPAQSHLDAHLIAGVDHNTLSFFPNVADRWDLNFMYSYIKLKENVDPNTLISQFDRLIGKYMAADAANVGIDPHEWGELRLVPLNNIHFEETTLAPIKPHGSYEQNLAFLAISILVLAIAVINFVNLSTARATRRAKEVSVRKVLGASRRQLITQYMTEAIFLTSIAAFLSLVMLELATPWLQAVLNNGMPALDYTDTRNIVIFVALVIAIGKAAGLYPAFVLSSYRPSKNLSIGRAEDAASIKMRQFLVVVQFTASIILIISTIVVYQQTLFARSVDLGFEKTGVIALEGMSADDVAPLVSTLKAELLQNPETIAVSSSTYTPGDRSEGNLTVRQPGDPSGEQILLSWQNMGYDYYKTLSITPVAGRVFSRDFPGDETIPREEGSDFATGNVIINMAAVAHLGYESPDDAIGKQLLVGNNASTTIIGVIPDIRYRSIRMPIRPSIHLLDNGPQFSLLIKYEAENRNAYENFLKSVWASVYPDKILRMDYLDERIDSQYGSEDRWSYVLLSFSLLAIMISSLGLLGLAVLTVENRVKEIGIRKVFGARVGQIVKMFLWQFTKPVIAANFVAWPIAWVSMNDWLSGFAYRIDLMIWPFLAAASFALLLAWFTVGTQAYKVALLNPIYALRHE